MKITKTGIVLLIVLILLLLAAAVPLTVSNFTQVHINRLPQGGTATPRLLVDNLDGPSVIAEFRTNGTPVARFPDGGGFDLLSGAFTNSGGQTNNNWFKIAAPTAIATATPALVVDNDGVSNQVEIREAATPIALVQGWGSVTVTTTTTKHIWELVDTSPVMTAGTNIYSALDIDLAIGNSTAGTNVVDAIRIDDITGDAQVTETALNIAGNGWDVGIDAGANTILNIGAAGTDFSATGGLTLADGLTVSSGNTDLAGTLQFGVDNNYALGYASSGQEIACVSATITGTAAVTVTGVTTPTWGVATLVTDPGAGAGDPFLVTVDAPTTTTLQVNVWQDDATAGASGAVVHVCAIGNE